jgi:hypothetical protein
VGLFRKRKKVGWRTGGSFEYAVDPRVPAYESWGPKGISGTINMPPFEGDPVIASKFDLKWRRAATAYMLWFVHEDIRIASEPDFYIGSHTIHTFHLDGTGGLIDYITGPLSIEWSVDAEAFDAAEVHLNELAEN